MKAIFGSKRKARKIHVDDEEETAFAKLSSKERKSKSASRLSFGFGNDAVGQGEDQTFTAKKLTLGRRVVESNALRQRHPSSTILSRDNYEEEERPKYNKDYLNELKSSTPSRPSVLESQAATIDDEGSLDVSELDGATIVNAEELNGSSVIPTEAEIREKKERRTRLAHEEDFISLNDPGPFSGRQLSLLPRQKKSEGRLVREDEDFAEGFEEFVDDGRITIGKKQEREAKRRHRKEMEEMIHQAEGSSDEDSDDSEAERRTAYESVQRRAGMDGLGRSDEAMEGANQVPPKITPLPVLSECLQRLRSTLSSMERELLERRNKIAGLEAEKATIAKREVEVQHLLQQSGAKYSALRPNATDAMVGSAQDIVERHAILSNEMADRGLENFGCTPSEALR